MVQHGASSPRYRIDAARHRALWPLDRAHRTTRRHARCRLRRPSDSLQGHRTATAQCAACRLDQSTQKGNYPTDHHNQLLAKLANKCISSPFTCSVADIKESIKRCSQTGIPVKGVIFNDIKFRPGGYGYGFEYGKCRYTQYQACPNVFREESAGCRLEVILGPPEYAKALFPTGFSRTG